MTYRCGSRNFKILNNCDVSPEPFIVGRKIGVKMRRRVDLLFVVLEMKSIYYTSKKLFEQLL